MAGAALPLYKDEIVKQNVRARLDLYRTKQPYRVKPGDD